jgi:hypothetical protein
MFGRCFQGRVSVAHCLAGCLDFRSEMADTDSAFSPAELDANRGGRVGPEQLSRFEAMLDSRHEGILGAVTRGIDPLGRDMRDGSVESIEGAMSKHTAVMRYGSRRYFRIANREAGQQQLRAPADIYEFAPDAGMARLFYLPRTRWVVNFEPLPDPPVGEHPLESLKRFGAEALEARRNHDPVGQAEALAGAAAVQREFETYMPRDVPQPATPPDPAALAATIVGTWESPLGTVTFKDDGAVTGRLATGMNGEGRWSVDPDGRIRGEGMGTSVVVDAAVQSNELTLSLDGRALRLKRAAGT